MGLYLLLHYGLPYTYRPNRELAGMAGGLAADIRAQLIFWLRNAPGFVLVAVGITYRRATPRPRPSADSREWAGRILAALIVVSAIIHPFRFGIGF